MDIINVLPQPRKTFFEIDVLGDDVAEKNLHELLRVARFDAEHCRNYLNEINAIWKTAFNIVENLKVSDFRELVNKFLFKRSAVRLVVERRSITAIHNFISYLNKVLNLFMEEKLGKKDAPFSHCSPVKVYRKLIDLELKAFPHIRQLLPQKEREKARQTLENTAVLLSQLEADLPEEPD